MLIQRLQLDAHARERTSKGRTDDRLPILHFERTFAVPDQEREVEHVLDRLRKVVRVDEESEKVDGAVLLHKQASNLK